MAENTMMKKYVLDVKLGRDTDINIDHAPDVTDEEFEKVLVELRKLDFSQFKFRPVNQFYVADFVKYLTKELNNIGTVIRCEQIEQFRLVFAFMA